MAKITAKRRAEIIDDLKKLNGLPPHHGFSVVRGDGYFANSLVAKYGMSLTEMAKVSGFDKVRKATAKLMAQAARIK